MATKCWLILFAFALLAGSTLADDDVGIFDMTNKIGVPVDVHCIVYAGQQQLLDLGVHNLVYGEDWTNFASGATTSVRCAFSFSLPGGSFGQNVPMWVNDDPNYSLPVTCNDCRWIIDAKGFSVQNPANQQYILVAGWDPKEEGSAS